MLKKVDRVSVADAVIEQLVDLIKRGELQPGDRVPGELELASELGVGRTTIREALKALQYMGLIERDHEGTVVSESALQKAFDRVIQVGVLTSQVDWRQLFQARRALEGEICALAAQQMNDDTMARVERLCARMEELGFEDQEAFFDLDMEFHKTLCELAGNFLLTSMWTLIHEMLEYRRAEILTSREIYKQSLENHSKLLEALRKRDPQAARDTIQRSLVISERLIASANERKDGR